MHFMGIGVSVVTSLMLATFVGPLVAPTSFEHEFMIGETSVGEFARSPSITAMVDTLTFPERHLDFPFEIPAKPTIMR